MAKRVAEAVDDCIVALAEQNRELAGQVVAGDDKIDREEVRIEKACIKLLTDTKLKPDHVRFLLCLIKINSDLERIADCATNIAEHIEGFIEREAPPLPAELRIMANSACGMVNNSVQAWMNQDSDQALEVMRTDDIVDSLYEQLADDLSKRLSSGKEPRNSANYLNYLVAARNFERIADHATNIAECVVQSATGEIIRHQAIRAFAE